MYNRNMKLTKYQHACFVLEQDARRLVVDPGNLSDDFVVPTGVVAVVITHLHPDHCDPAKLQAILAENPAAVLYGLAEVAQRAGQPVTAVQAGDTVEAGPFVLEFTGGQHAVIHPDIEPIGNLGLVVNDDLLYYPGDSFSLPPRRPRWIAAPVAAPWMKLSEAVEFLRAIKPEHAFPTHDAILSPAGKEIADRVAGNLAKNIDYHRLVLSETIEL